MGSKPDINGNRYWFVYLTNLNTRKQLCLYEEYEGEISHLLRSEHNIDSQEIYEYTEMFPIRQWKAFRKNIEKDKNTYPEFMSYGNTRKKYINSIL